MSTTPTSTSYAVHGPVAVVTLNNPPVNGLGHALRSGIVAALDQSLADPQVQAIVLTGSARAFSGGGGQGAAGLFEVCSDNGPIAGHEQPRSNSHECETTF